MRAIEGTYSNGKIELASTPPGVEQSRIVVVFLDSQDSVSPSLTPQQADAQELTGIRREQAIADLMQMMKKGFNLGGPPYLTREEIHDRNAARQGRD